MGDHMPRAPGPAGGSGVVGGGVAGRLGGLEAARCPAGPGSTWLAPWAAGLVLTGVH